MWENIMKDDFLNEKKYEGINHEDFKMYISYILNKEIGDLIKTYEKSFIINERTVNNRIFKDGLSKKKLLNLKTMINDDSDIRSYMMYSRYLLGLDFYCYLEDIKLIRELDRLLLIKYKKFKK